MQQNSRLNNPMGFKMHALMSKVLFCINHVVRMEAFTMVGYLDCSFPVRVKRMRSAVIHKEFAEGFFTFIMNLKAPTTGIFISYLNDVDSIC